MSLVNYAKKIGVCLSVNHEGTDKEYNHLYLSRVYEPLFKQVKPIKKILEIGIGGGNSIVLWKKFLSPELIFAVDSNLHFFNKFKSRNLQGVQAVLGDAYSQAIVKSLPENFDLIIDDGPHSYWSLKAVIRNYTPKLRIGGTLVIEDIPEIESVLNKLMLSANSKLVCCFWLIDSRMDARLKEDSVTLIVHRTGTDCHLVFDSGTKVITASKFRSISIKALLAFERITEFVNRKIYHGLRFRIIRISHAFLRVI